MFSKQYTFECLIFFSLLCFAFFGSLSHFFNFLLLGFLAFHFLSDKKFSIVSLKSLVLFLALNSAFFVFFIRSFFHHDTWASVESLSPMLPIPIIAIMILLANRDVFRIQAAKLALSAKIAIVTASIIYFILLAGLGSSYGLHQHFTGRLELFSGNPIPFSTAVFGIAIFTFVDWKAENWKKRIITIITCLLGFYIAGVLSGTRGTLLAITLSAPILLWFISQSFWISISIVTIILGLGYFLKAIGLDIIDINYVERILRGVETLLKEEKTDYSINIRMEVWQAAVRSIADVPTFGYDVSNRFMALKLYLREDFPYSFTHPHNDIFASIISIGFFGLFLSIISLLSTIWAALLSDNNVSSRLFIGGLIAIGIICTANVNTVLFNDITAAWLAFSSFLIWNVKYSRY